MVLLVAAAMAQVQRPYSTHDSTASSISPEPIDQFREGWADVKTPGDGNVLPGIGRQYSVGTVEVRTTQNAIFSGASAEPVTLVPAMVQLLPFSLLAGQKRQVVMIQCTNAEPFDAANPTDFQSIKWQKYFYGSSAFAGASDRASNARAIAVWPTSDASTTRIAICGETYDEQLPGTSQSFTAATASAPTGFIAVLDGNGDLRWTHHFFGSDPAHSCAITDVSIRVESDGREVVTYCGISSHGDPGAGTSLTFLRAAAACLAGPSGQWDGIVGRVSRSAAGVAPEFHSPTSLSSFLLDGALGLAEVEVDYAAQPAIDLFAVVGGAANAGNAGTFGTIILFDAAPTRQATPGDLSREDIEFLGTGFEEERHTLARDVVLLRDGFFDAAAGVPRNCLAVVGSTDDSQLFTGLPVSFPFAGGTDGFLFLASITPADPLGPPPTLASAELRGGAFFGGPGDDGFTGVQSWNEYPDQIVGAGFTQGPTGGADFDIGVASYYLISDVIGASPSGVRQLRQEQIGGSMVPAMGFSANERPAAMGLLNATTVGLSFPTFGLDDPAGGGVAVDQRARVNVVGYTEAADYPAPLPGRPRDAGVPADAVRSVFDMLPPKIGTQTFGIGRTDRSGDQGPFVLPAGLTGGSTPACALSPFGRRIGDPPPVLSRMLLEYEGDAPAANVVMNGALIVSRPSSLVFTAWQWDIPGVGGTPPAVLLMAPPVINGVEVFVPQAVLTGGPIIFAGVGMPGHSIRVLINFVVALPLPAPAMTVQVICWFPGNPQPGGLTCTGSDTTEMVGSAGMWLPL